jgi:translation initiation factor eIF-2B subunit delta
MASARMSWVTNTNFLFERGVETFVPVALSIVKKTNLKDISPSQNLEKLNPLYDLTPPTYITAVVTEVGLIPPSSMSSIPLALGKTSL